MTDNVQNPLKKYFRQPGLYIKLPSNGKYWPEGSLDLTATNEIPVYPMTVNDEIILKTPDALISGQGMVDVIQSCCPNIKNAWEIPSIDMDKILVSIRITSYGEKLEFDTTCPKCSEKNIYEFNLHTVLDKQVMPDYSKPVEVNNLKIFLKPQSFFNVNKVNQIQFEEQQLLKTFIDSTLPAETKAVEFSTHMKKLIELNELNLTESTDKIITESGDEVIDKEFITQFYHECDSKVVRLIRDRLDQIKKQFELDPFKIECASCHHNYEQTFVFEYSNFFG